MKAAEVIQQTADEVLASLNDPNAIWDTAERFKYPPELIPTEYLYALEDVQIFFIVADVGEQIAITCAGKVSPETAFRLATNPAADLLEDYKFFDDGSVAFWFKGTRR